ncbi:hypothetical protein IAU59_000050 [Kwoniella sp. CBS 9459]
MTDSADSSVCLPAPVVLTPSLKPVPDSDFSQDMDHLRFIQPFDLRRYHSPALPFPVSLDDGAHPFDTTQPPDSDLTQTSSDRSKHLQWPPQLQAQPPSLQPSPTLSCATPELPQSQIDFHSVLQPRSHSTFVYPPHHISQKTEQTDSKTPLRRALGLDQPLVSQTTGWPGKAYTPQVYEPPRQTFHANSGSGHSHSQSTPALTPYPTSGTPYQSHLLTPFQHTHSYSYSYSHPEPAPITHQSSSLPDDYKIPQPGYWSHVHAQTPSSRWESQSPYQQPLFASFGIDARSEDGKRQERLVKARRHVCPVCDKRFNRPSSLNTHMAVHTGAKPYVCNRPDCGRRFSVSSNLRRHERTHENRAARERQVGIETIHRISQPGATPVYDNDLPHEPYKFPHQAQSQPHTLSPPLNYTYYQPYATPPPAPYPTPSSTACSGHESTPNVPLNGPPANSDFGLAQYQVVTKPRRVMELGMDSFEFPRRPTAIDHGQLQTQRQGYGHAHSASFGSASTEMDAKAEMLLS